MSMAIKLPIARPANDQNTVSGSPLQQALKHQGTILRFLQELKLVPEGYSEKDLQKRLIVAKPGHVRLTISQELDIILHASKKDGRLTSITWVRHLLAKKKRAVILENGKQYYQIIMCASVDFEGLLMNRYDQLEPPFDNGNVLITAW